MDFIVVKEIPVSERAITPEKELRVLLHEFDISEAQFVRVDFENSEFSSTATAGMVLRKTIDMMEYHFRVVTRGRQIYLMKM